MSTMWVQFPPDAPFRYYLTIMIECGKFRYLELPEFIKDQVCRELDYEGNGISDEEFEAKAKKMLFSLFEYDPQDTNDRIIIEEHFRDKVQAEGDPDPDVVNEIGSSGRILDPVLIIGGSCKEGRHRLAAALKYRLKIRAYVL